MPLPGGVSYWFKQDEIHQATHVHNGPAFLPWHRELCNRFEALLRQVDPQLSLHYWDWTTDPHGLFTSSFMGAANGSAGAPWLNAGLYNPTATPFRADNPFDPNNNPADPPRTLTRNLPPGGPPSGGPGWPSDQTILNAPTFPQMRFLLESAHNSSHSYIGGTIGDPHTSFRDPFVFLLHSNVDRLFARWQTDPANPWRLDPNQVYGSEGSTTGLRGIMTPLDPWAGNPSNDPAIRRVRPWAPPESQQVVKNSKHPTVVAPPAYDTNRGGWASLGGVLTSAPTATRNADGRLEVFVRGTDNALYNRWQTAPNNGWSANWGNLGGVLTSNIAAARNADGRLEVFVRGTDNALWHRWQTAPNNGWS